MPYLRLLSRVRVFVTLWTVAQQVALSMGFFRQEHWSGWPFPPPGDLPPPGIEPLSPALADGLYRTERTAVLQDQREGEQPVSGQQFLLPDLSNVSLLPSLRCVS